MNLNGVVMLVNDFAPMTGGAEKQAERLSGFMASAGKKVMVITRHFPGLPYHEIRNGFDIYRVLSQGPGKIKTIMFVIGTLFKLWRFRKNYTILHAHMLFGPAFAAAIAGWFLKKKVIIKLGSSGPDGEIQTSLRSLRGRVRLAVLRKWVNAIVVLDETMYSEAISVGFSKDRIYSVANGIDSMAFEPVCSITEYKSRFGLQDKTIVLFIGRFVSQKSLPTLFKAAKKALVDCPDLHFVLVGTGSEYDHLRNLAIELDILDHIYFSGNQIDVKPYLHSAEIFVLPSESEGMSNALMEAMASGLLCIATPVGANGSLLDHGKCGVLVPVRDDVSLANAIIYFAKYPGQRQKLGNAAKERIKTNYDFSVVGARYIGIYQEMLEKS